MRLRLAVALVLLLVVLPATAAAQLEFCGPSDRACALLTVPLDRSGAVPGSVTLTVERMPARSPQDPPLFLLAGGPGQSATRAFPDEDVRFILDDALARRDVVLLDQRGTGDSGVLRCPALQRARADELVAAAEQCGTSLGAGREYYATADSVADLEALRAALRYERIALLGVSYGAKLALDYAAAFPGRVERLVLDSPVPQGGRDPLYRSSFAATPRVLDDLCRRRCARFTADPVDDVTRLLGRLPLRGSVGTPGGERESAELTRFDLFFTLAAGDLEPGLRVRFPAAVRSALRGDLAPLLRLERLAQQGGAFGAREFSAATYAATICAEAALPWDRSATPDQRTAQARAAAESQPPAAFAPFDAEAALGSDLLRTCERWPAPGRPADAGPGALPDVPVLLLSGSQDVRTPREDAARIAALFPQAQLFSAPGAGHSVLAADRSDCAGNAVRRFLRGRRVPSACARLALEPTRPDPTSLPRGGTRARRTLVAVRRTYQDALRLYFDLFSQNVIDDPLGLDSERFGAGGLRAGRFLFTSSGRAHMRGLVYIPGVRVTGRLSSVSIFPDGVLRVGGPAAAHGKLRVSSGVMRGRLGGRRVRGKLGPDLFDLSVRTSFPLPPF